MAHDDSLLAGEGPAMKNLNVNLGAAHDFAWYVARSPGLARVGKETPKGARVYLDLCPAPEHGDRHPSLLIFHNKDGSAVPYCRSHGCSRKDIDAAFALVPPAEHPHDPDQGYDPRSTGSDDDRPRKHRWSADPRWEGRKPYSQEDLDALAEQIARLNGYMSNGHEAVDDDHGDAGPQDEGDAPPDQDEPHEALQWLSEHLGGVAIPFLETQPLRAIYKDGKPAIAYDHEGYPQTKIRLAGANSHAGSSWHPEGTSGLPDFWPTLAPPFPPVLYVSESYTDTLVLRALGLPAHALAHGAQTTIGAHVWRALAQAGGKEIRAVFDCDEAGVTGAAKLLASARDAGLSTGRIDIFPHVDVFRGGKDVVDAYRRYGPALRARLVPEQRRSRLPHRTMAQIATDAEAPDEWLIRNVLPRTGLVVLSGDSGVGKLDVLLMLFQAAQLGLPFLGNPVERFPIVYMSEDGEAVLRNRSKVYGPEEWHDIHVATLDKVLTLGLDWSSTVDEALALCLETGARHCAFDTALKWAQLEDANSQTEVVAMLMQLRRFNAHGISYSLVTHDRKASGVHGQQVAGSVQWQGDAQMLFDLQRTEDDKVRRLVLERKRLNLDPGQGGPYYLRKEDDQSPVMLQDKPPKAIKETEERYKIVEFVRASKGDGRTAKEVADFMDMQETTAKRKLDAWCKPTWDLLFKKPDTGTPAKTNPVRYCCTLDIDPPSEGEWAP